MKKIIIIRHAKSDWSNNTSDLDRPISTRGVNDAKIISKYLTPKIYGQKLYIQALQKEQLKPRGFLEKDLSFYSI